MAQYYQSRILSAVTPDEAEQWRAAVALAETQGAFVLGVPIIALPGRNRDGRGQPKASFAVQRLGTGLGRKLRSLNAGVRRRGGG